MSHFHEEELNWEQRFELVEENHWREEGIALYRRWLPSLEGQERLRAKMALGKRLGSKNNPRELLEG